MEADNEELKLKLLRAEQIIKELNEEIDLNRKNWTLYFFDIVQTELEKYHYVFNPHPVNVKASHNNKPLTYSLKPTDIICVIADGKEKHIYLKSAIKNSEGILFKTDKIPVNRNNLTLAEFRDELDSLSYFLVQISRSVIVNIDCYHKNKKKLQLLLDTEYPECKAFNIGENFITDYQKKKDSFDYVVSLQRLNARAKD
jgi:hypothetical protein